MAATSAAKKSSSASTRMPIEDYDKLSVKQILPRLTGLSAAELATVASYEKKGKNRVTLLRGVRQVELAREAARGRRPAKHLTVVEDASAAIADAEPVADSEWVSFDDPDSLDEEAFAADPTSLEIDPLEIESPDGVSLDGQSIAGQSFDEQAFDDESFDAQSFDDESFDDESDEELRPGPATAAPEVIATKVAPVTEPKKKKSPKPAVKHATWEEELRPQLPRRLETTAFEYEYEPPVIALEGGPSGASIPAGGSISTLKESRPAKVRRKIDGMALVMAAILAVLLGLAIGTLLARTGGTTAQPAPSSVAGQASAVQTGS